MEFLAASVRLRKRTVWLSRAAVAALVVLAVLAAGSAVIAWKQRDDAVFEQVLAEADRVQHSDPSLAAQLDLVAHRLRPGDEGTYSRLISIVNAPLATPLSGHTGAVYLTSFSPDGHTLATAGHDRTVRLWNVRDPHRPAALGAPLTGHASWVSSAVFGPDGRTLASAGDDGTVRLWDVTDPAHAVPLGKPLTGHRGTIYLVAFSPDGRTLATAGEDRTVRLWDVSRRDRPRPVGSAARAHRRGALGGVRTGRADARDGGRRRHRSGCGTCPPRAGRRRCGRCEGTRTWCTRWPSGRTGTPWPAAARTTPSGCGTCPIRAARHPSARR